MSHWDYILNVAIIGIASSDIFTQLNTVAIKSYYYHIHFNLLLCNMGTRGVQRIFYLPGR